MTSDILLCKILEGGRSKLKSILFISYVLFLINIKKKKPNKQLVIVFLHKLQKSANILQLI